MWWLVVLVVFSFVIPARAADAQPMLLVERPVFDFGSVEQGAIVEHVFRLRNGGTAPLRVEQVKSTCACTVGAVVGRDVAPGDETWVTVQLDTGALSGSTAKTVTIYTNDPRRRASGLSLQGTVLADVVLDPPILYFGTAAAGEERRHEVRVRPGRPGGAVRVARVRAPSFMRARLRADPVDATLQILELTLRPDAPAGQLSGDVVLETSERSGSELFLPVFGSVRAEADPS